MTDISKEIEAQAPQVGFSGAEYNHVATNAELEAIVLLSSQFSFNLEHLPRRNEWKLSYGRKIKTCQFNAEQSSVAAIFEYHMTAKVGRAIALRCVANYAVFYETPAGTTEQAARGFCGNVGVFAAYPYFRALLARMAAEAGVTLPPLPSIASTAHIPPKKAEAQKDKGR
jgi:hypothetical protein